MFVIWEDPDNLGYETDYTYDALDNLTGVVQNFSRNRTFTYDGLSRLTSATNPESGAISYSYDANGNILQKTSPAPNQTGSATVTLSYCYDTLNRLTAKAYTAQSCPMSSPVATYLYDQSSYNGLTISNGIGRRTGMTDQAGSEAWSFDSIGRPLADQRFTSAIFRGHPSFTRTTSYSYNLDGSIKTLTYASGRTFTYAYNSAARPISLSDQNGVSYASGAAYSPSGALASLTNASGLASRFYYNSRLQPCRISVRSGGAGPTSCADTAHIGNLLDYTYNFSLGTADNGNVTSITNNRDNTRSQNFTYDALNRLATAQTQTTGVTIPNSNCWGLTFGYDAWGNLLSGFTTGPAGCGEPMPLNVSSTTSNQLVGYCYDSAGNLLDQGSCPTTGPHAYVYNAENQMIGLSGATNTYRYDGDGKRVTKTQGAKFYWYGVGSDALDEMSDSFVYTGEYVFFGGKRIARIDSSGNTGYYFVDHLGSSRVVTNPSGSILDDSDFYPFGGERPITSSSGNSYKFTGKERDAESGLDNFDARYNSSNLGRFMSPDPDNAGASPDNPQSWNAYSYVLNNPVNATDPSGLWCVWEDGTHDDDMRNGGASEGNCGDQGGHWDPYDTITGIYQKDGIVTQINTIYGPPCTDSNCGAGTTLEGFDQTLKSYSQLPDDSPTWVGIMSFFTFLGGPGNKPTCAEKALTQVAGEVVGPIFNHPALEAGAKGASQIQAGRALKYAANRVNTHGGTGLL
jgi:RHS repeat-associated protein